MNELFGKYRFRIARRSLQILVLLLFTTGSTLGWTVLRGDLSSSKVLGVLPLTDPFAVLQILAAGIAVSSQALLGAGIVLVFFGLVAGRAFCSWVCPVNMITDAADRFRPGKSGIVTPAKSSRYWILGMSLVLSLVLGRAAFEAVSPLSLVQRGIIFGAGQGLVAVPALFLFDLLVARRGFCGHFCPLGAFYSLVGRSSILRVRHDAEACTRCMKCVTACHEPQVLERVGFTSGSVASGECTLCGRCIEACGEGAMRFSLKLLERSR